MNVRLQRALVVIAAGMLLCPSAARSFTLPDMPSWKYEAPYLLRDPLRTQPEILQKGVVLPGDSTPIPSSVTKDFSKPLTLSEAIDLALSNNHKVKSAWADIKVQTGSLGEARATYLPSVSGNLNWTKDNISYSNSLYRTVDTDRFNMQASATWRLLDFGGRAANRRAMEHLLAAAIATYDTTLQDTLASVIQSYFDAVTANAALTAKQKDEEIAQSTLHSAQEREAKGVVSRSDTLRATTALAKATLDKNRALGDYQKNLALLIRSLGLPGDTRLTLPAELNEQPEGAPAQQTLAAWLGEAQKNHPAIVSAKKQLAAAEEQVAVAKSAGLPTLNLSGNYYRNTSPGQAVTQTDAQETTVVVSLSIPFFEGFATTYKIRGAQAKAEKQKAVLADTQELVATNVIKAYADANSTLRNLAASQTLLTSAQDALATSQRKYDKGAADITEVLSTQSDLANAWNERVRCLSEWNSARLQLLVSAGRMGRSAAESGQQQH